MTCRNLYAVVLAGGSGERLWPLSTPDRPKQFVDLFGGKTLLRQAVERLGGLVPVERVLVITADCLVAMTRRALPQVPRANIIGEPCRRNTAAAVAVACGLVKRLGGDDAACCVVTADQLMKPEGAFRQTMRDAIRAATESDSIVTVGIRPDYPATGFGYIECGKPVDCGTRAETRRVVRFVEKPDEKTARRYLRTNRFLWNSGMFIWRASVMESAFAAAAPDLAVLIDVAARARNVRAALKREYVNVRSISVDYAVMEKIRNLLVVRSSFVWDDVGSWLSLANHFPADGKGNVALGATLALDSEDCSIVSDDRHVTAVVGMRDAVVVHTPHATLVCAKASLGRLRDVVRRIAEEPKTRRCTE